MKRLIHPGVMLIGLGIAALLLVGILMPSIAIEAQNGGVALIAHADVPANPLSKTDVQNLFLGKKTKIEAASVTIVILQEGAAHEQFLKEYLSRTPDQYMKYWKKLIFTGEGKAPKSFATEAELLDYVEKTEGVIGYVSTTTVQNTQSQNIHQLTVQ